MGGQLNEWVGLRGCYYYHASPLYRSRESVDDDWVGFSLRSASALHSRMSDSLLSVGLD